MSTTTTPYPAEAWTIRELSFDPLLARRNETIFFLGNGHLGMRGNFEEGFPSGAVGTYINGFYEETPIVYGEIAYGYAKNRQVMLNVADGKVIRATFGGEELDLSNGELLAYERSLDLRQGFLTRTVRWRSPMGRELELRARRVVSFRRRHVAAIDWSVTLLKGEGSLVIESAIDGSVGNISSGDDPRIGAHFRDRPLAVTRSDARGMQGVLEQRTGATRFSLACAMDHRLEARGSNAVAAEAVAAEESASVVLRADGEPGTTIHLTKYLGYCTSLEHRSKDPAPGELASRAEEAVAQARDAGFDALLAEQKETLDELWHAADVQIEGDEALQQGLRFNLYSLFQSAGRDGRTSIAAKGLSGEGYEGHYFWDTEIYVLPFFIYTQPAIARSLIRYRLGILDKARARAVEMSQRGALFPWRTIGGEETSAYFPAGTAQYHINADIVHAFRTYIEATGDRTLLAERGAEMLFETARLWADLGAYIPRKGGAFCINEVTGPDEYTALVNNNLYTNLMARENLQFAADIAESMATHTPAEYARIAAAIDLKEAEIAAWKKAARLMYMPFDKELGIHMQDDQFLDREPWDIANTPATRFPLLLHHHPLVIYRRQVLKQPDVVLAQVLLGNRFSMAEKKRNFDYYDPLTTGDSSLSPCIQSVAAAEVGYTETAYQYFSRTARMDLDDVNGNVEDGLHTAAMAGTWISLVYGFAGMRDYEGKLSFAPRLPARWKSLRFRVLHQGSLLEVTLTHDAATYLLVTGKAMVVSHRGNSVTLETGRPFSLSLAPALACVILDSDGPQGPLDERWLPRVRSLLAGLRSRGIRTALVSLRDSAAEAARRLQIAGMVDLGIDGASVLKSRPDPEAFFRVAEELGVPNECCAGLSAAADGVQATAAAGMFAVGLGAEASANRAFAAAATNRGFAAAATNRGFAAESPDDLTLEKLMTRFAGS
jgi:trehalose/maltose hydrolase-like predicted phosphorylase